MQSIIIIHENKIFIKSKAQITAENQTVLWHIVNAVIEMRLYDIFSRDIFCYNQERNLKATKDK